MTREEFLICRNYASLDLALGFFTLYDDVEGIVDEEDEMPSRDELYGAPEKGYYDWFVRVLRQLVLQEEGADRLEVAAAAEAELRELRRENRKRMEFLTALTDRLTVYEHVLNRCELRYDSEEKLDEFLKSHPEEDFFARFIEYVKGGGKESGGERIKECIEELPTQLTRQKLFDTIDRTMTLYLDGDETALDEFIYIIRMAALVSDPGELLGEYPVLEKPMRDFESTDLKEMSEERYNMLRDEFYEVSWKLECVIDFYNELQRCINGTLSLCLVCKWLPEEESPISSDERDVIVRVLTDSMDSSLFSALEGKIEPIVEKLNRVMARVEAPDMNGEEEEEYLDVATLARLLSNSMFAEIDPLFVETRTVTRELLHEKEEALFEEMTAVLKGVQKPVKKAIMAHLLRYLAPVFGKLENFEEYLRVNLFGCRDKAEKCASMAILLDIFEQGSYV